MRVAFDARHAGRGLGISTVATQLARELVALGGIELVWLGEPALAPPGSAGAVRLAPAPYPLLDGPLGRALVRRLGAEVIHFTGNTGWGRRGPVASVLTLQDLIFLSSPGHGRSLRQIAGHAYERRLIGHALASADVVAVSSQAVGAEVAARFGAAIAPEVVPYGVTPPPRQLSGASDHTQHERRPYLLAFAGRDPRKRTAEVVAAWRALTAPDAQPPLELDLRLLAGAGLAPDLREALTPGLAGGCVTILDHLPREQVWRELEGALALAYPSTAEGFGLPVLEAMAVGVPVLSGLAPATREVGGDAIVALDPGDIAGSITAAVRALASDPQRREALAAAGRARAARFTWHATAQGYLRLYELARERHRCGS